jgi:putative NADPH-quinone reductase
MPLIATRFIVVPSRAAAIRYRAAVSSRAPLLEREAKSVNRHASDAGMLITLPAVGATVPKRITIIQGHPDPADHHFCHALAESYRAGAESAGFAVRTITVGSLSFPLIRNKEDFEDGERPDLIREAQSMIRTSDHLVIVYPLWLGTMPALLKGFLEQVFRYDFAFAPEADGRFRRLLSGRSARVVVTMGMPTLAYRYYFGAHGLKSLERSILKFSGISPVRESLFGRVEEVDDATRRRWLRKMQSLGRAGR